MLKPLCLGGMAAVLVEKRLLLRTCVGKVKTSGGCQLRAELEGRKGPLTDGQSLVATTFVSV